MSKKKKIAVAVTVILVIAAAAAAYLLYSGGFLINLWQRPNRPARQHRTRQLRCLLFIRNITTEIRILWVGSRLKARI